MFLQIFFQPIHLHGELSNFFRVFGFFLALYAICPKEAISMVEDEEGFEYPQIDEGKCVRCYRCIKVCPFKVEKTSEM